MSERAAAESIYYAMQQGRAVVTPGWINRIYANFLTKVLSTTALAELCKVIMIMIPIIIRIAMTTAIIMLIIIIIIIIIMIIIIIIALQR